MVLLYQFFRHDDDTDHPFQFLIPVSPFYLPPQEPGSIPGKPFPQIFGCSYLDFHMDDNTRFGMDFDIQYPAFVHVEFFFQVRVHDGKVIVLLGRQIQGSFEKGGEEFDVPLVAEEKPENKIVQGGEDFLLHSASIRYGFWPVFSPYIGHRDVGWLYQTEKFVKNRQFVNLVAVINIILDPIFIFGFDWGIAGAA
jgi:hypothetical protein